MPLNQRQRVGDFHRTDVQAAMDNVLDTFSGGDGGVRYVVFCQYVQQLDSQAESGDDAAKEILKVITRFSRLVDLAQG